MQACTALCAAVGHTQMIADPLASAIGKRLPERFAQIKAISVENVAQVTTENARLLFSLASS